MNTSFIGAERTRIVGKTPGQLTRRTVPASGRRDGPGSGVFVGSILKSIRVDDWVFGVSSVSKDGWESPVASAVPGGAFKPYVKPAEPAK